ncbi:MAG: Molecular chaperone (DnaJ superfamily), partial [Paramarteilia canceri]
MSSPEQLNEIKRINSTKNLYKILGTEENADSDTIKKAYRRGARLVHPDQNGDSEESSKAFSTLTNAFTILSDKNKRKEYDLSTKYNNMQNRQFVFRQRPYNNFTYYNYH